MHIARLPFQKIGSLVKPIFISNSWSLYSFLAKDTEITKFFLECELPLKL